MPTRAWLVVPIAVAASSAAAERTRESIAKVVAAKADAMRECYAQASKRAPKLGGTYVYKIEVRADGHVKKASAAKPSKLTKALDRCMTGQLAQLAFEPGAEVTINYPFVFDAAASKAKSDTVDPELVTMFNAAAEQGKAGKHAEALAGYRAVLEAQRKRKLAAIPRFLATVHLQASYSLIDLNRLAEAEKELGLVDVASLGKPTQYDFHFTRGNVLGGLGKLRPMFAELVEAISLAEDLDDMNVRPQQCWTKILAFTMKAKDWTYLAEVADKALSVARVRGWKDIETKALASLEEAKQHRP